MKIAHVCARYFPFFGGVEVHVQNISENLVARGYEVSVFTTDPTGKLPKVSTINGIRINRFKAFAPQESYYFSASLFKALKSAHVDLIHGHGLQSFPLWLGSLAKGQRKFVATLHSGGTSSRFRRSLRFPYERFILHHALKKAEKIICVSTYELRMYPRVLRISPTKFMYIPNGTDIASSIEAHQPKTSRMILSVGRLERWKGFHTVIESFAILRNEKGFEDLELVIVGKGPLKRELVNLAHKTGVARNVTMAEDIPRKELIELYHQCDAFVHLCDHGYPGIAAFEAIALRKPVVTPTLGVMKSYVEEGYCLGVDSPPNPLEVAEKLRNVLENPNAFRPAKMRILTWNDVTERLIVLYEGISKHTALA